MNPRPLRPPPATDAPRRVRNLLAVLGDGDRAAAHGADPPLRDLPAGAARPSPPGGSSHCSGEPTEAHFLNLKARHPFLTLLKEPLLHFILLGALVFGLARWIDPDEAPPEQLITVPTGKVEQLATIFAKTWQRTPTRQELEGLIDDYILEEAYTREAINMGLEKDDTIIRRRLRQKLEFLTGDLIALTDPTDEDLQAYLEANPDKFREDPRLSFRQVFLDPGRLDGDPSAAAQTALEQLRAGEEVEGHPTLLPAAREDTPLRVISGTFGASFAQQLEAKPTGEWQGPVQSSYGIHLVRVDEHVPGRLPPLEEIRATVQREWAHERKEEMTRQFNRELLDRYTIRVEWPETDAPES